MSATTFPTEPRPPQSVASAADQLSAYFLDLDRMLGRIETATTYYQILGLDRGDGQEKVKSAFEELVELLFPPYVVGRTMPADVTSRIERAFTKSSQAFAVLASFSRRRDYDDALQSIASKPVSNAPKPPQRVVTQPPASQIAVAKNRGDRPADVATARDNIELNLSVPHIGEVYRESSKAKQSENRRRCERFKLTIPARVTGYDRTGTKWHEMTETLDVSRTGLRLKLRRKVRHGTVLFVTLPLPSKLRAHGFTEQSYNVYTLVRRVEPQKYGVRAIGVEFLGEHPPKGFLDTPWAIFRSKRWGGDERRRPDREQHIENLRLEYFDENKQLISAEQAKTENVSRTGLRIAGTKAPPEFDMLRVICVRLKFDGMAAVRSRYRGKDGEERLCVQFVEKEWPVQD